MFYKKSAFLMGTQIEIVIESKRNTLQEIYEAFGIFYSYEGEFSRFMNESSLSVLNTNKTLEVSSRFLEVLELTKEIYKKTDGYFNPLINLSNIGYSHSFSENNFEKILSDTNLNLEKIKIKGHNITLMQEQSLDFGGIVKGYCVDIVRTHFLSKGLHNFIINAGGDIYVSGTNSGNNWIIGIDNPFISGNLIGTIKLKDKSISTSGSYKRNWKIEDKSYHHIINPNTEQTEKSEIISLSLIADDTYISDTYATACFSMGIKKAQEFLETNNIDSLIISVNGEMFISEGFKNHNFKTL